MARYIDVDELIQGLKCAMDKMLIGTDSAEELTRLQLNDTIEWLNSTPTADVVEVVRCKDCKHGDVIIISRTKDGQKRIACYCELEKSVTDVDAYCSCGEKRGTTDDKQ